MTETREQWIEREAREARARYWKDDDKWHEGNNASRQGWRNVVAPYYQEPAPLRVPVDVDGLADAIRCAEGRYWKWEDISEASQKGFRKCARAALAYLNIEPCAAPEYNPDDVALRPNERAELENLRAECKRLRIQRCEWADAEVEELQRRLGAIIGKIRNTKFSECYCECDDKGNLTLGCSHCELHARAVAIAEGRDNG